MRAWVRRRRTVAAAVALAVVVALIVVAALGGTRWWSARHRTDLQQAIDYAPSGTVRFSWTDWAGVRRQLHAHLDGGSSVAQVQDFLDQGYDADLTSGSAMVDSMPLLQGSYGVSPATAEWELLAQGEQGSVLIVRLPDSMDVARLGDTLTRLGYAAPSGGSAGGSSGGSGVYLGDDDLLSRLTVDNGLDLSPQYTDLALDAGRHLLLASDNGAYVRQAYAGLADTHTAGGDGLAEVAHAVGAPLSAEVYSGDYACRFLAMGQAADDDEAAGKELVAAAGGVDPVDGFAIAADAGGTVQVAMSFDSSDEARHDAASRAKLASGPAPGQGGDFPGRFHLGRVTVHDDVVTMDLHPRSGRAVLSDLASGPVLFASC